MSYSAEMEKQQIYVSERLYASLRRDAELFEFYHKDGMRVNFNRFLTSLLTGYSSQFLQEQAEIQEGLGQILEEFHPGCKSNSVLIQRLMEEFSRQEKIRPGEKNSVRLSLKPTAASEQILSEIRVRIGSEVSFSNYLRGLLAQYSAKPIYEREKILFRDNVELIENACKNRRAIVFRLYTNPGCLHYMIPYDLTRGPEEMFNYLVGQEYNPKSKKAEPRSYRLCRILRPSRHVSSEELEETVVSSLEFMKKYGPQYVMLRETETCVRVSEKGRQSFRMIYLGRPKVYDIKPQADGSALYYFHGPVSQILQYFRRFKAEDAEVLYPESLRSSLRKFYKTGFQVYSAPSADKEEGCENV